MNNKCVLKNPVIFKILFISILVIPFILANIGCQKKSDSLDLFGDGITAEKLDQVTLNFFFIGRQYQKDEMREVLDEIEKRTAKTLNIKLNFTFFPYYLYQSEIQKIISNGEDCDMFEYNTYGSTDFLQELYDKGIALDITTLFPKYAPKYYAKLEPQKLALHKRSGKLLAVPNNITFVYNMCALVRDDMMQKYNLLPIKSLDDFEVYLDKIKNNEDILITLSVNDTVLGLFAQGFGYVILDHEMALVYKWDDPDMKIIPWEQTAEYREAVERVYNWYKKGYFLKDTFWLEPDNEIIRNERIAGLISYQLSVFNLNTILFEAGKNWRYLEYPLYPGQMAQRFSFTEEGMVVSAYSKHPERALMFIEWIHANQENYDLLRYGIKKKHYLLKKDQYTFPNNVTSRNAFMNWQNFMFVDIDYERTNIANSKTYKDKVLQSYHTASNYPPHGDFIPDYAGLKSVSRKLSRVVMENTIRIGKYDSDAIENFIKDQKDQGIDALVIAVQAQLDEWRNKKDETQ